MRYLQEEAIDHLSTLYKEIEEDDENLSLNIELHTLKYTKKQKKNTKTGTTILDIQNSLSLCYPEFIFEFNEEDFKIINFSEVRSILFNFFITIPNKYQKVYIDTVSTLDKIVNIDNSTIYSLKNKIGPFINSYWFYCYFFYNKKLKKNIILSIQQKKV
ncbi:Maf1 negative regulator of RNA polymerase III [Spraguea lophii 42_110]|uniref:Maf1 negative regulator of RNA polymerase III n=1 Tax=Spraguea lophii (strain 42_110) TaxID=1358809 RepID=S7XS07_SPRLO|nr:Maf1 negative regulator of RNA polymerase III [Spraguea lophii 42_110]